MSLGFESKQKERTEVFFVSYDIPYGVRLGRKKTKIKRFYEALEDDFVLKQIVITESCELLCYQKRVRNLQSSFERNVYNIINGDKRSVCQNST